MKKNKQNIVSELRFPEFIKSKGWSKITVDKLVKDGVLFPQKDGNHGNIHPKSSDFVSKGIPFIMANNIRNGKVCYSNCKYISKKQADSLQKGFAKEGDVLITHKGTVGEVAIIGVNEYPYLMLTPQVTYYRVKDKSKLSNEFLRWFFLSDKFQNTLLNISGGGTRAYIGITAQGKLIICIPPTLAEQQKIANCLTSLNNLITIETEKLDNLKDHKKGLLQQLFPANRETKPQFRFPEFENDGDWIETILEEVADYENGKAHEQEISTVGKYKVVNSKFISTEGRVVKFTDSANLKANVGDVLMVLSDIPNGKAIAKCFYVDKDDTYTVNQRICKITPTDIDNKFLFYIQNRNSYFLAFDDGVKQTNLRKETILSFPFLMPKELKEQQKIANCLSSVDDLIESQKIKIKNLKKHKKGLMQQLFPNINDIDI